MLHPETLPLARAFKTAGLKTWLIGANAVELREKDRMDVWALEKLITPVS